MATSKQTYIHTRNFRKCSHASVGLAQACPNKTLIKVVVQALLTSIHQSLGIFMLTYTSDNTTYLFEPFSELVQPVTQQR